MSAIKQKNFDFPKGSFPDELENLINSHSIENGSNTKNSR